MIMILIMLQIASGSLDPGLNSGEEYAITQPKEYPSTVINRAP